jgi:hypothetical protein
MRRKRAYIN